MSPSPMTRFSAPATAGIFFRTGSAPWAIRLSYCCLSSGVRLLHAQTRHRATTAERRFIVFLALSKESRPPPIAGCDGGQIKNLLLLHLVFRVFRLIP